jgi:tetratricopeptide (TPR) repeat protein
MSQVFSLLIARFTQLPRNPAEVLQGGLVRLPAWVEKGPDGRPYRPWAAIWVSLRTGMVHMKMEPESGTHDPGLALETLLEFSLNTKLAGCRPARLEVADEAVGAYVVRALGDDRLTFSVSADLPAVKQVLAHYGQAMSGGPLPPDGLDAPGMTIERMRAFGEAAKRFYLAAPWRYLTDEDLIHVEAPRVEPGLRHVTVLGGAGQVFGLGFFETPEDFEAVHADPDPETVMQGRSRWAVWYGPIQEMSFGDADLWEDRGLPVAGEQAYPVALRVGPDTQVVRPDATVLAYLEGLLLALAETSEGEIDQGRWTRQVQTLDGPKTFTFCVPSLLEPLDAPRPATRGGIPDRRIMERFMAQVERFMAESDFEDLDEANRAMQDRFVGGPLDAIPSTATTPLEKAQDLIYRAVEARGRRRTQLARKALELSADCADAYVLLAEQASGAEAARDLYAQGVAAGERALGPRTFEEDAGHFWGMVRTRPYMRARFGLARCLEDLGQVDQAIGHYQELLRLNPNDNQGVRDVLLPALLAAGRDGEAGALLEQFDDDISASWQYGWALWTFRQEGDSERARERLRAAVRANRYVPRYLTGQAQWPGSLPASYAFGSDEEAVICAREVGDAWRATSGAVEWLTASASTPRRKLKPKGKARRRHRR